MSLASPAVSLVLPVRNGMPYLPRAIESILCQTLDDFELLVIDDGSEDRTTDYLQSLDDPRVRQCSSGGRGLAAALNAGLALARAPLVARQDADDWSHPERLDAQVRWMRAHQDLDVLATEATFVDANGDPLVTPWTRAVHAQWDAAVDSAAIAALMPLTCCIFHATVMARTAVLRAAGGYDAGMVPAEDYDLWLRLLPSHRFARLSRPLYTVRVHDASSSAMRRADQIERVIVAKLRYLRRVAPDLPSGATLALPCADRGADYFRQLAPVEQFEVVDPAGPGTAWAVEGQIATPRADVVAVTDFSRLDAYAARLTGDGVYYQVGNLFVRQQYWSRGERRAQTRGAERQAEALADPR